MLHRSHNQLKCSDLGWMCEGRPASRQGFSLIELLMVVTVIAVLLSLAMPMLRTARDAARSVVCCNSLRQLQTANLAYSVDNRGCFVPSYRQDADGEARDTWMDNASFVLLVLQDSNLDISAATKASVLLKKQLCPLSKRNPTTSAIATSYGYNFPSTVLPTPTHYAIPHTWLASPGQKVAFVDGLDWRLNYAKSSPAAYWHSGMPTVEGGTSKTVAYRHRSLADAAFYDGHVAPLHWNQLYVTSSWY